MKTIVLEEPGKFIRTETPRPRRLDAGQALVRVRRVGICGTDLHAFRGRQPFFSYPRILGHELGVEVLALDGATVADRAPEGIRVGDLCAVEPYLNCGECIACRRGRTNCCTSLQVLGVHTDGGMREEIVVPVNKLHRSETLKAEQLALVETLGIGAHAVGRASPEAAEIILVVGAGPIGLAVVQFALLAGAKVWVVELDAARREFCERNFAVEGCLDAADRPLEALGEALSGDLPTIVFDATGSRDSMQTSFQYVSSTGKLVLVGIYKGEISFDDPEFHRKELTVLSSRNSVAAEFRRIIAHLEAGEIDVRPWITHHASYDDLVESFPGWLEPGAVVVKAVLRM